MSWSKLSLLTCYLILFLAAVVYVPRWDTGKKIISYDISGYYFYLPAAFIYNDVKKLDWMDDVFKKYAPTRDLQQAFKHPSGNYVMKYSCGQALMYSPFFALAHLYASNSTKFEADGFSVPYQFALFYGSIVVAFIGLFFFQKILLHFFDEKTTGISLLMLVIGTNYFEYTAFTGAMTHNYLFTIYAVLIYTTIKFYKEPSAEKAILIGFLIGLAALIRPTEIISALIPILWNVKIFSWDSVQRRIQLFKEHFSLLVLAVLTCIAVGSIQLFYWKYASGDWVVYSYEDQGFNWLGPYIGPFLFSFKSGWLVYTPLMIFSIVGFVPLYQKNKKLFWVCFVYVILIIYISSAWRIWWYGGSLGQRTMVQAYVVLMLPLAYFIDWLRTRKVLLKGIVIALFSVFSAFNFWITYQAHFGGLFIAEQMTEAYFFKVLGTFEKNENDLKLLDTDEEFLGERQNVKQLFFSDFENTPMDSICDTEAISGSKSLCLNNNLNAGPVFFTNLSNSDASWVRVSADFKCKGGEWNWWKMSQLKVGFYSDEKLIKEKKIRVHRFIKNNKVRNLFIDTECPKKRFNKVGVVIDRMHFSGQLVIDNLKIESFD